MPKLVHNNYTTEMTQTLASGCNKDLRTWASLSPQHPANIDSKPTRTLDTEPPISRTEELTHLRSRSTVYLTPTTRPDDGFNVLPNGTWIPFPKCDVATVSVLRLRRNLAAVTVLTPHVFLLVALERQPTACHENNAQAPYHAWQATNTLAGPTLPYIRPFAIGIAHQVAPRSKTPDTRHAHYTRLCQPALAIRWLGQQARPSDLHPRRKAPLTLALTATTAVPATCTVQCACRFVAR
ncbi:hypothetical protein FRC12_001097 [Ceratobasidium sp. 428]|nr:hypothetical protein FRC12_001097 [Ceratobasidium sp. 428]